MRAILILVVTAGLSLASCAKDNPQGTKSQDQQATMEPAKATPNALVQVPKEGKKFEPPIAPSQVPEGAWYCDMGTVEYARGEQGDGRCPICRMRLKQKVAERK